ncbi:type IV pilus modification protein PilV [Herbaspirillum sp. LeCh32-8]|uniref:type IV pilus modification protein PilV n=1 Tax=Herbaspirillum sp. LeCh32-8 TaxID=2821356 RepID=UPI001AE19033|nr:type IV pilus modification protein PilV [Herbaspirillum sp. LeCh32-8]MBP0597610.1 type IV pilus modification protein PilV [Herbaspirillum sp. LeCh32-8]
MRSSSSGFTMTEVLVALLVIGTGALAMLMLQLHVLRSHRDATLQASATAMALELAELRAAYRAAAPDGPDPYLFVFDASNAATGSTAVAPDCRSGCDADGFVRAGIAQWNERLARELPGAHAVVCRDGRTDAGDDWRCDDDPAAAVIVKLGWRSGADAARAAQAGPMLALPIGR